MAISSRRRKRSSGPPLVDTEALSHRLVAGGATYAVPLLVVRLRDLERIAWREGRTAARLLEKRSLQSFVVTASRTLRAGDVLAHDEESEDFLAVLVSPTRKPGTVATPADCRATLARLASAMEEGGLRVETGWTMLRGMVADSDLADAVENALERGARERERYDFFSIIGHELRTPLTSIRGFLETLLDDESLDAETTRRFLEIARSEATRLGRLVDELFDLSMMDLRAGSDPAESCQLYAVLGAALAAVAPLAVERKTSLEQAAPGDLEVAVGADRLIQVLINVIENAIKHGDPGGHVRVSVHVLDSRYVEIRIDDDGPGVPAGDREAIFTLASRGSNARVKGSGIGLAVVRLMLERFGGEVEVTESELGGAGFRIRVPLVRPPQSLKSSTTITPAGGSFTEAMPTRA